MMDRDEISLQEIFQILWRERRIIMAITLTFAVAVTAVALMQKNKYEATIVMSPISNNPTSGKLGGGLSSSIGGLAALAGITVGGDSNRAEAIAVLQSQSLTERFIAENDLLPILYADDWDAATRTWKVDASDRPTLWKGAQLFDKIREVTDDKKTGMVTLTVKWTDAALAAQWANGLVKMTNDVLRSKAVHESDEHIEYLTAQALQTDVAPVRGAIYSILESEIKKSMLAKGPGDFALKVIDPAITPERKTTPIRSLWVLVGTFAGFLVSLVVVFIRHTWRAGAVERAAAV